MPKILVIDESFLFRSYLKQKFEDYGFEVDIGINGLDGMIKLRSQLPDLVIMDFYLSRKSSMEILQDKQNNPNTAPIPLILLTPNIDKRKLISIAQFNVKKIFSKPIKIDAMLKAISEILNIPLEFDVTPCLIEAHINTDILFIEIANGLNTEKIELLKYKITELLEIYKIKIPKVLIIMSDIKLKHIENNKIKALLHNIIEYAHVQPENIKILTHSTFVKDYVSEHQFLKQIEIIDNLERAMDTLTGVKISNFVDEGKGIIKQDLIERTEIIEDKTIQLKFEAESLQAESDKLQVLGKQIAISIVDDDIVIQELITTVFNKPGWEVSCFSNGKEFINATQEKTFDLVFLDLLMPEMNGFEVLRSLKQHNNNTPVIVLSALSKRETVIKALNYGVRSYMIKPLKPERIIKKASEILTISY